MEATVTESADTADTAIIGAGIAGMSAARVLLDQNCGVIVFDKSRGPGGRAARRRQDAMEFDHGAQYFTARDQEFASQVAAWRKAGIVEEWTGKVVSLDERHEESKPQPRRYVGVPGMSSIARYLGRGAEVRYDRCLAFIERCSAGWQLLFEGGSTAGPFKYLLLTMPAPQANRLLAPVCPHLAEQAGTVRMSPCWATMLAFERRLDVDFDAAFVQTPGPIRWLARNSSKPHRPSGEAWVVHARPDWTAEHLERSQDEVVECMTHAFEQLVECRAEPILSMAHRWRYALVEHPVGESSLYDQELRLGAAGDWCLGPRIESAFCSGQSAAAQIIGDKSNPH